MSKQNMFLQRQAGRVAIITGAGRGIGAATALRLAQEGAAICVNDLNLENARSVVAEIEKMGGRAIANSADISVLAEARKLVEETKAKFGRVDICVNNAGITRDALLHKTTEEQWDQVIRVNLKGVFNCLQASTVAMLENKWGRVVNISSVSALGNIGQTNYSASKAGVMGMTATAALELAKTGVTVNAIAPGFFDTALTQAIPSEVKEKLVARIPVRRMGDPAELAAAIAFLVSDEAAYITGQTLFVDGGLSVGL